MILGIFLAINGICWLLVYVIVIYKGFKENTYGIPTVAACLNISWEFIFSFLYPHSGPVLFVNIGWFFLDIIIIYQILKYWKYEFPQYTKKMFYSGFSIIFISAFMMVFLITLEFQDFDGIYSAFPQNLLMSVLFILMLQRRNSLRGQSIYVGLLKMIGSTGASLYYLFVFLPDNPSILIPFVCGAIFVYDLIYVIQFIQLGKNEGVNIWKIT